MKIIIETKYNVGDIVYYMWSNKIYMFKIISYRIDSVPESTRISYSLERRDFSGCVYTTANETECYSSREDVIKSL